MPGALPPEHVRQLQAMAGASNTVRQMVSQQQTGVGGAGSLSLQEGTLFKQDGAAGGWTKGSGIEIVGAEGKPMLRAGTITWRNPHSGEVTEPMLAAFDDEGNVRFTISAAKLFGHSGVLKWKANGELEGAIYEY